MQNLKIGDKFTINRSMDNDEATFDFTNIVIDDNKWRDVFMEVIFKENEKSNISITVNIDDKTGLQNWKLYITPYEEWAGISDERTVLNNFFKQTFTIPNYLKDFHKKINTTTVLLIYEPYSEFCRTRFTYFFKSTTSNPYEVEVVGYKINDSSTDTTENNGDNLGYNL